MADSEDLASRRAFKKAQEKETPFRRAELFHKELMEDFRFMEAARMHSDDFDSTYINTSHLRPYHRFRDLMLTNPHGLVSFAPYTQKPEESNEDNNKIVLAAKDLRSLRFSTRMAKSPPLEIFAHWLLNTYFFRALMVVVIILNSVLIAVTMEIDTGTQTHEAQEAFESIDFFFVCLFVIEIILKWFDDFRNFWNEPWNIFDFTITSVSLVAPSLDLLFDEETLVEQEEDLEQLFLIVKYLRIIRIFRSLNVVTRIHKIRLIWEAVVKTFKELFFITVLMAIFFYIYAVIGVRIFERYSASHKMHRAYRPAFSSIWMALVTLFQLFTLDHYAELMEEIRETTADKLYPPLYILSWIFLGNFVFQNIFTGVMVNNFQNIRQDLKDEETQIQEHQKLAIDMNIFGDSDKDGKLNEDPHMGWEDEVFHNLKILSALKERISPTIWPRDTLFQYYMILEAIANNMEEKNHLIKLLDHSVMRQFDQ